MKDTSRRFVLGVLALIAAPACGDPLGIDDVLGIWTTTSINGHAVPGTVVYQNNTYDTEYARWVLYDDGLCTLTQLVDGLTRTYDECDYTVNFDPETITISFQSQPWIGTFGQNHMTITDPQDAVWELTRD